MLVLQSEHTQVLGPGFSSMSHPISSSLGTQGDGCPSARKKGGVAVEVPHVGPQEWLLWFAKDAPTTGRPQLQGYVSSVMSSSGKVHSVSSLLLMDVFWREGL